MVVSEDIAHEIRSRCDFEGRDLPSSIQDFVAALTEVVSDRPPELTHLGGQA
jgi:hypothetical protein